MTDSKQFTDVSTEEANVGVAHVHDRYPNIMVTLNILTVLRIANSVGNKSHLGKSFRKALRDSLYGNLARDTRPGSVRYGAYSAAVSHIFNKRAQAVRAATRVEEMVENIEVPSDISSVPESFFVEKAEQMYFDFSRLSVGRADP